MNGISAARLNRQNADLVCWRTRKELAMKEEPGLIGQRFGRYTVIGPDGTAAGGKRRWLCRCDCGKTGSVLESNLKSGHSGSCGCARRRDLTGSRVGRLTVLERSDQYASRGKRRVPLWKCRCDCGAVTYNATDTLTNPAQSMCGECAGKYAAAKARGAAGYMEGTQLSRITDLSPDSGNATRIRGVYYDPRNRKYRARLKLQGRMHNLGSFSTLEEAVSARRAAEEDIFGAFLLQHGLNTAPERAESQL